MASCAQSRLRAEDVTTLEVTCDECPQLPLRILGLIAQRGLCPEHFECRRTADALNITLAMTGSLSPDADSLANKIGGMIGVRNVSLTPKAVMKLPEG